MNELYPILNNGLFLSEISSTAGKVSPGQSLALL